MIELHHSKPVDSGIVKKLTDLWPQVAEQAGWVKMIERDSEWGATESRLEQCESVGKVLILGIGGSSLGTQMIHDAFRSSSDTDVFFLESVDRYSFDRLRALGDWRERHVVIVSKSGGTLETLTWVERLAALDRGWIRPEQVTVIASPGDGALQTWARQNKLPLLWIPEDVGGRFSVLSSVGMFPAGLMGLSRFEFRSGARWALSQVDLVAELAAASLKSWEQGLWITQMWTYSEALRTLGPWWQQLWSESLAKRVDLNGKPAPRVSTPMSCMGSRDQHSLLQQLMEGARDKYVFLVRARSAEAAGEEFTAQEFPQLPFYKKAVSLGGVLGVEARSFEQSLKDAAIPYSGLELNTLNEQSLGAMVMIWQMAVGLLGAYLNIDAYNQPGVELGKRHAEKILRQ